MKFSILNIIGLSLLSLTITGCNMSEEVTTTQDINKLKPAYEISKEVDLNVGSIFEFGSYPQSVIPLDDEIYDQDLKNNTFCGETSNAIIHYRYINGNRYDVGVSSAIYQSDLTKFNDSSEINRWQTYFFKVEPIKWIIVENTDNILTLISLFYLDTIEVYYNDFYENKDLTYYSWKYSNVRSFLNNEFYDTAFQGICETTTNKISSSILYTRNPLEYEGETIDKVYVFDSKEYKKYSETIVGTTQKYEVESGSTLYGHYSFPTDYVIAKGELNDFVLRNKDSRNTIRPVIRIKYSTI